MITAKFLKDIAEEARPALRKHREVALFLAGLREVVAAQGGDWSSLKALLKAEIDDEEDEAGDGKRVKKILDKADYSAAYADMLGIANMNERNFSAERETPQRAPKPSESMDRLISAAKTAGPRVADIKAQLVESESADPETGEILKDAINSLSDVGVIAVSATGRTVELKPREKACAHESQAKAGVEMAGSEREQPVTESASRPDARRSASATSEIMDATGGERPAQNAPRPSKRGVNANDKPSSEVGPQAEASLAGTGTEMPADREGHFSEGEALADEAATLDRHVSASPLPCDDLEIPAFLLRAKPPPQPST